MDKRNYSSDYYVNNPTSKMHGTIEPDTCYLNEIDKILFWIEIKEQKIKNPPLVLLSAGQHKSAFSSSFSKYDNEITSPIL